MRKLGNRNIENAILFCLAMSLFFHKRWLRGAILSALFAGAIALAGCGGHNLAKPGEVAYVAAPQVTLRDRVATVFNKVGTVDNGEKVTILDRTKNGRFVRVRS